MAVNSKSGSFNVTTQAATNTVSESGFGFQPEALLLWWSGRTESTDTVGRLDGKLGFGVATSTSSRWAATIQQEDAQATSDTDRKLVTTACIVIDDTGGATDGLMDLQSFDSGGFTLVIDQQFGTDVRVNYLALGGDITNAGAGTFSTATAEGNDSITSLSFQPECVLFVSVGPSTDGTHALFNIGFAVSPSARATFTGQDLHSQADPVTNGYGLSTECLGIPTSVDGSMPVRADFVTFLVNGFTLDYTEVAGSAWTVGYLALAGGSYAVGNIQTQTDTVTSIPATGLGFKPSSALLISACRAASTLDTMTAPLLLSIGAFDATDSRGAQGILSEDAPASGNSEVTPAIETDAVYLNIDNSSALQGLMDIQSIDADGFTCIMDDADPSQSFVGYMAFGPAEEPFAAVARRPNPLLRM
jgi:hypothetical protein